jgi:hypothetical protein
MVHVVRNDDDDDGGTTWSILSLVVVVFGYGTVDSFSWGGRSESEWLILSLDIFTTISCGRWLFSIVYCLLFCCYIHRIFLHDDFRVWKKRWLSSLSFRPFNPSLGKSSTCLKFSDSQKTTCQRSQGRHPSRKARFYTLTE